MPETASHPPEDDGRGEGHGDGHGGGDPAREPIYRAIRWLMAVDMVLGVVLAAFGGEIFGTSSIRYAGAILALIGAVLFLLLGRLAQQARDRS
jgi:hypothetical protein